MLLAADCVPTKEALTQSVITVSESVLMTNKKTQVTPKGAEIPVPKRSDFLSNLKKASALEKPKSRNRPKK